MSAGCHGEGETGSSGLKKQIIAKLFHGKVWSVYPSLMSEQDSAAYYAR